MKALHKDIIAGKVQGVEIIPHIKVKQAVEQHLKEATERYRRHPSRDNGKRLENAEKYLEHVMRDGELLIKGHVPAQYIRKK